MDSPLFEITGKKLKKIMDERIAARATFLEDANNRIKKVTKLKSVTAAYISRGADTRIAGISFKDDKVPERLKPLLKARKDARTVYVNRRNTKAAKELGKDLGIGSEFTAFDDEFIKDTMKFKNYTIVGSGMRVFSVGYAKIEDNTRYFFKAYPGYEPPRGVKEITYSTMQRAYDKAEKLKEKEE